MFHYVGLYSIAHFSKFLKMQTYCRYYILFAPWSRDTTRKLSSPFGIIVALESISVKGHFCKDVVMSLTRKIPTSDDTHGTVLAFKAFVVFTSTCNFTQSWRVTCQQLPIWLPWMCIAVLSRCSPFPRFTPFSFLAANIYPFSPRLAGYWLHPDKHDFKEKPTRPMKC